MGSGSKKHKKDKDAKKHKRKSRSPRYSPDTRIVLVRDSDKESRKHHHKHRERESRSRSPPIKLSQSQRSRSRSPQERSKEKRHHHHRHHKHHKDRRQQRQRSVERAEEYHSDSSDVIEVPLAPPAPIISKENARSSSPIPENGAGDYLSIDETNKLRAKLGLKPLETESTAPVKQTSEKKNNQGLSSYKDEWGEFLHKPAEHIGEKAAAEKLREKLKQRKEKRFLEDKLKKVQTLGESDEEVDDINKWVQRSKKKNDMRKEADRRAKMLEEMDAEFGVDHLVEEEHRNRKRQAYRDKDLKGLQVEHDLDEFTEGKTVILTLKDKGVLDDNDDALINVNLIEEERYRKNVENRKQKPNFYGYDVYEEQYDEFGQPIDRGILGKYDEEIGGAKKKTFTIGESIEDAIAHKRRLLEIKTKLAGKRLESLNEPILKPAVDTFSEAELVKFKKPKKKVKRLRQKLKADDLLPLSGPMESSSRDFGRRRRGGLKGSLITDDTVAMDENMSNMKFEVEDEDDLQRALSKARKLKQMENIIRKPLPTDIQIKPEIKSEPESDEEMSENGKEAPNITLNATAEFCRTLGDIPTYGMAGNREVDSNDIMDFDAEEPEPEILESNKPVPNTGTWNSVNPDSISIVLSDDNSNDVSDIAILDEEPDVGAGVAAALRLALSKGYLEKEDKNRPSNSKMAHLQAKNYSIEDKTHGDEDKFGRRDRYHAGPIMDFKERETFKPNVKLEYIDDNGRILNAKEAFRYLSHKFHGKGPGKNKIEKRLKKMEQEGLMKKMSSTDTPLGTLSMLQMKQKETQAPYVVLSGGKQTQVSTSISKHK